MFDYAAARTHMVDSQIHTAGVVDPRILQAFQSVPREMFVPDSRKTVSYYDEDLPLGGGRFLMEPGVHSRMLQALELSPDDVVLDVGAASGYSSAILSPLVGTVIALEQDAALARQSQEILPGLDVCNVVSITGPLSEGCAEHAPYHAIIVNGAVAQIPENLVSQLAEGGRMIVILRQPAQPLGQVTIICRNSGKAMDSKGYSIYSLFEAGCSYLCGFEPQAGFTF